MSDLVELLYAHGGNERSLRVEPQLMGKAASEIVRLRTALAAAEAEKVEAVKAENHRCFTIAKFVGETFLLDLTAKPAWQDGPTWGRQETIRHILAAIRRGEEA